MAKKKNTEPKFVYLTLHVMIPLQNAWKLATDNTPSNPGETTEDWFQRVRGNAKVFLASDQETPFEMVREATDKVFLLFESYEVIPHSFDDKTNEGIFEVKLVTTQEYYDRWVDTDRIKRVAKDK